MNGFEKRIGLLSAFLTVDGEVNIWGQGGWSVFLRTAGCGVGCVWCDTKYSWHKNGGEKLLPSEIVELVRQVDQGMKKVTITGGEPLEQDHEALASLISLLHEKRYHVTVETSGTQNTAEFRRNFSHMLPHDKRDLSFIVDYKLESSHYVGKMDVENHFALLRRGDFVKFVITNESDFWEAVHIARILDSSPYFYAMMYFSPTHGEMEPHKLFWLMRKAGMPGMNVGMNLQLHKYMFPDDVRNEEDEGGIDFTKRTLGRDRFLSRIKHTGA